MRYSSNGSFDLRKLVLVIEEPDGERNNLDLTQAYIQLDLYESIYDHTMSGSVSFVDVENLKDIIPLYGNEKIELNFTTLGSENNIEYQGIIYKISDKHRLTEHASGYTIYFTSEETLNSQKMNVQQGYIKPASEIVSSLYNKIRGERRKILFNRQTKSIQKYVFGSVKPFSAIETLIPTAYSIENEHGYLFYEDNKQFNFVPIEYLYKQEPSTEFHYKNKGMFQDVEQRAIESFNAIQSIEYLEDDSLIDRMMDGLQGRNAYRLNLVSKSLEKFEYDRDKSYDRNLSLGKFPYKKKLDVSYESAETIDYGSRFDTALRSQTFSEMSPYINDTIRVKIAVFGDSFIRAGNTCLASLPNWNMNQKDVKNLIDGKFLMTEIHHSLNQKEYKQVIMLQKDAFG